MSNLIKEIRLLKEKHLNAWQDEIECELFWVKIRIEIQTKWCFRNYGILPKPWD